MHEFFYSCRDCDTFNPAVTVCVNCGNLNIPGGVFKTNGCRGTLCNGRPFDPIKDKALADQMASMNPRRFKLERPFFSQRTPALLALRGPTPPAPASPRVVYRTATTDGYEGLVQRHQESLRLRSIAERAAEWLRLAGA